MDLEGEAGQPRVDSQAQEIYIPRAGRRGVSVVRCDGKKLGKHTTLACVGACSSLAVKSPYMLCVCETEKRSVSVLNVAEETVKRCYIHTPGIQDMPSDLIENNSIDLLSGSDTFGTGVISDITSDSFQADSLLLPSVLSDRSLVTASKLRKKGLVDIRRPSDTGRQFSIAALAHWRHYLQIWGWQGIEITS